VQSSRGKWEVGRHSPFLRANVRTGGDRAAVFQDPAARGSEHWKKILLHQRNHSLKVGQQKKLAATKCFVASRKRLVTAKKNIKCS